MQLGLQVYQKYFQVYVNDGLLGPYFRALLYPEKYQIMSKFRILAIFTKSFYCMTIKHDLHGYQRYFHVYVKHGLWGPYFQAFHNPEKPSKV